MKGNITKRGKNSFRLKFDAGIDANGKRKIQYHTFRGTKREAQDRLTELMASVGKGSYVEPSKIMVADFVRGRIDQWEASGKISAVTAARYRELNENQIAPHIGARVLQKLRRTDIESWHTTLRNSGHAKGNTTIRAPSAVRRASFAQATPSSSPRIKLSMAISQTDPRRISIWARVRATIGASSSGAPGPG